MLDVVALGAFWLDRTRRVRRAAVREGMVLESEPRSHELADRLGEGALGQAEWCSRMGLRCGVIGLLADDERGARIRALLDDRGIADLSLPHGPACGEQLRFIDEQGEALAHRAPPQLQVIGAAQLRAHFGEAIRGARVLLLEPAGLSREAALEALEIARQARLWTVVVEDPAMPSVPGGPGRMQNRADLLVLANRVFEEAAADPQLVARALRGAHDCEIAVVGSGAGFALSAVPGALGARPESDGDVELWLDAPGGCEGARRCDAFVAGLLAGALAGGAPARAARLGLECARRHGGEDEAELVESLHEAARGLGLGLAEAPRRPVGPAPRERAASAGLAVLDAAAEELARLRDRTDGRALLAAAHAIESAQARGGRVHFTGMGKPEQVARYAASLFSSTGTRATFMDAGEALHGGLGQIAPGDLVIAISNSGETRELVRCAKALRDFGARLVAITGAPGSPLARLAEVVLDAAVDREGGPLGLAPRASVLAQLTVVAALGALLQERAGFTRDDYAARHPEGKLGRLARSVLGAG